MVAQMCGQRVVYIIQSGEMRLEQGLKIEESGYRQGLEEHICKMNGKEGPVSPSALMLSFIPLSTSKHAASWL